MIAAWRGKLRLVVLASATLAALAGVVIAAAPAAAAPSLLPPQTVVAASSAVESLNGLAVASDGSGGMVFMEAVAGVPHVFVSRLERGAWTQPVQVDAGLGGASSQPQIAAGDNGELVVAFVNSGAVYVSDARRADKRFSAPAAIATGAANPSVAVDPLGAGYLAYTAQHGAGDDVDVDYFNGRRWRAAHPHAVNVTAGDDAGTGAGAPDVAVAQDGVGIVAWGEGGHVYARRVWGRSTSTQTVMVDQGTIPGWTEVSADSPRVAAGWDSSFPDIAFREVVTAGGVTQSRVLVTRLIAEDVIPAVPVDGLTAGGEGATQPQLAMNTPNNGLVTTATATTNQLIATPILNNGFLGTTGAVPPGGGAALPYAVPATAGSSNIVAWQESPAGGSPEVVVSYALRGHLPRAPAAASSAASGPTDAAAGLFAAGDSLGDAAVAWVQGTPGALSIEAAELIAHAVNVNPSHRFAYATSSTPTLRWQRSIEAWGPVAYQVTVDGVAVGTTDALQLQVPTALTDGPHKWQVTSTNEASRSSSGVVRAVFVDTNPPILHAKLGGAGRRVRLRLRYVDTPKPGQPGARASGIAGTTVNWGDGPTVGVRSLARPRASRHDHRVTYTVTVTHAYRQNGRYTLRARVTDRAGNATTFTRKLVIGPGANGRVRLKATAKPAATPNAHRTVTATAAAASLPDATPPVKGALMSDGPANRYRLGGSWLARPDPTDVGIEQGWFEFQPATTGWTPVTLPNSYNAGDLSAASDAGSVSWYRRDFTLPKRAFPKYVPRRERRWLIQFESVNYRATVWLNGHELGTHQGAYLPFEFVMRHLRARGNQLVVRVDDRRHPGDFPPPSDGGWWDYGGILDAVYVRPVAGSEIDNVRIRTRLRCTTCRARISEQATVRNLSAKPEVVSLTGLYGTAPLSFGRHRIKPGGTWKPIARTRIAHPRLWAPGSPNLYRATLLLANRQGKPIAGYSYESGVRQISVVSGRLYLNGRQLHLRGVNLHEQTAKSGAALTLADERRYISWFQQLDANIVRAHYPLNPELEQMADQAGILLWSEVPVYQSSQKVQKQAGWRRRAVALVEADIRANQSHPSILVWSIGNELGSPPMPPQVEYVRQAARAANRLDPTRPVAMAIDDWPGLACQAKEYGPLQVIGINEYFGWFNTNAATANRNELGPFMRSVRSCYRKPAIFVTEFGFGGDRNGPVEVRGTYQFQVNSIQFHLGVFDNLPWLSAAIYFPVQDFASRPDFSGGDPLGHPPWVDKGVIDQFGHKKPAFAVMASLYKSFKQIGRQVLTKLPQPTTQATLRSATT